jgi:hypothetical protein
MSLRSIFIGCFLICGLHLEATFEIKMSETEKRAAYQIIKSMGDYNIVSLLLRQRELRRLGKMIDHIPPTYFLGYIFSDPILKNSMRRIRDNYFKWTTFIEGLSPKMDEMARSGLLYQQLPHFADYLRINYDNLYERCRQHDWEEFVKQLM